MESFLFRYRRHAFALLVAVSVISYGVLSTKRERQEIDKHLAVTVGTITKHTHAGSSGTVTYFEYFVNGKRYEATSGDDKRFGDCKYTGSCIGLRFKVEYSFRDPQISRIIWSEPR